MGIRIKVDSTAGGVNNSPSRLGSSFSGGHQTGVADPGEWTLGSDPGSNTQATATKAASGDATAPHVCRSFLVTLSVSAAAAVAQCTFRIIDGASGGPTILYQGKLCVPATAGSFVWAGLSDLNLVGTPNTAMTIEFTGIPGAANVFQTVSMSGYTAR